MTTTDTVTTGHAIAAGKGERIWIVGDTMTFKATGESTGGSLMLFENLTVAGGWSSPARSHPRGRVLVRARRDLRDPDRRRGARGRGLRTAYAPRGAVHNFRNTGETPGRILVGFTPGGMEGFFRDSGRPATDDGQAPPVDQDEIARTMAAAPKYGVEAVAFDD